MPQREVFVASSDEANPYVRSLVTRLSVALGDEYHVVGWYDTVWANLTTALRSLDDSVRLFDYAIFFFHPDDKILIRGEHKYQARDNVVLEFGLFLPILGFDRTFLIRPSHPHFHMPSDIGEATTVQTYACALSDPSAHSAVPPGIDDAAILAVSAEVATRIRADANRRMRAHRDATAARENLDNALLKYRANFKDLTNNNASDTRLLNGASEYIKDLLALKATANQRPVRDVVEDLGLYFELIDDVLNISQLAARQRKRVDAPIDEVWVFADDPLEFSDNVAGEAIKQVPRLLETVAYNLKNGVKYFYFVNHEYRLADLESIFARCGVSHEQLNQNITFFLLAKSVFQTFYTIHKYDGQIVDIFMSAIMKERNDLMIKVSQTQQTRIYSRISTLVGYQLHNAGCGLKYRNFYP